MSEMVDKELNAEQKRARLSARKERVQVFLMRAKLFIEAKAKDCKAQKIEVKAKECAAEKILSPLCKTAVRYFEGIVWHAMTGANWKEHFAGVLSFYEISAKDIEEELFKLSKGN